MTGPRPVVIGASSNPFDSPTRCIRRIRPQKEIRRSCRYPLRANSIQFIHEQLHIKSTAPISFTVKQRVTSYSEDLLFGSDVPATFIGFNLVPISRVIARQSKAVGGAERRGGADGAALVAV
jgi:hypothetical protein